jgi:hypothetical protein
MSSRDVQFNLIAADKISGGLYLLEENCPGYFEAVNGPVTVISTLPGFS